MTFDPQEAILPSADFEKAVGHWISLTYALNSLNRGMGLHDLYPFVLSGGTIKKLAFINRLVRDARVATK